MLISFTVGNFLSFNEDQEFSMIAGPSADHKNHIKMQNGVDILRFGAIYGPNASGKSNLIKALFYAKSAFFGGYLSEEDRGYGLSGNLAYRNVSGIQSTEPSRFKFVFSTEKGVYQYGFDYNTATLRHVSEWLVRVGSDSDELIFNIDYTNSDNNQFCSDSLNRVFNDFRLSERRDSHNSVPFVLFYLSENDSLSEEFEYIFDWFDNLLVQTSVDDPLYFGFNPGFLDCLCDYLQQLDTGITGYRLVPVFSDLSEEFLHIEKQVFTPFGRLYSNAVSYDYSTYTPFFNGFSNECPYTLVSFANNIFVAVRSSDDGILFAELQFQHNSSNHYFSFSQESEGTKKLIRLLSNILGETSHSIVSVIDEIECNVHPLAIRNIISKFLSDD